MKNSFALLLILFSATVCCSQKDYTVFSRANRVGGPGWDGRIMAGAAEEQENDTVIFLCGVSYPRGCEWRTDSCRSGFTPELVLFRNGEKVLSLETGTDREISDDPDMHHLIGGHLYTEYSSATETVVRRDGTELFRYPGREFLRGLLVEDDDVFTLGQSRDDEGFTLRCNGAPLISRKTGYVSEGFGLLNYNGNGALFRDNGRLCFCYNFNSNTFLMADGVDSPYSNRLLTESQDISYYEHYLLWYSDPEYPSIVFYSQDNRFLINAAWDVEGRQFFYPPEGGYFSGGCLYLAITPMEPGAKPALWKNGQTDTLDFNGYLTGLEICTSPADSS